MRQLNLRTLGDGEYGVCIPINQLRMAGLVDEDTDELVEEGQSVVLDVDDLETPTWRIVAPSSDDDLADVLG